jgi:Fur family ferric uptake transcriptional regulator
VGGVQLVDELRARGVRVTQPRQLVWDVLSDHSGHLSAAEVAEQVHTRDPGVNQSSVYRALALFAELDLVRESRSGDDSATTWEIRHPDGMIHLLCESCGTVLHHRTDRVEQLRRDLVRAGGFAPATIDVRVTGRCANCP